ncbi:peroxiredoxin-like family protein [Paenibacillus radicis (ex Xue et al. 2023)]|uniref:thioredoxin-dependent peroxiredoxin n=1 Tax=Paenibacillus radicis (ex Xue et al. 2023) TaxID=2972489 RepID=A0ABT1YHR3_9BACL|nr:peroxiredoxin-like family protein [Paenibacillus radicis (ex Xue et al. 2023)]MCR8632723.1 AhpC/TSA family protein [Paenibacillus radicis (ex Xue et al. 2023)]
MSMREQLDQSKKAFIANAPEEVQSEIFRHIRKQQQSGIALGLKEGDKSPNFKLTNPLNDQVILYDELVKGPVVLTFYRGSWCPFCNIQLRAYQQILPEIEKLGGQLIAVTPQIPDNSLSHKEKEKLTFQVLSDPNGRVAASYQVLFEVPNYIQNVFTNTFRLDLTEFNACDRWVLPIPATYIIDKDGIIRRTHVNPDFMNRMEPREIVEQLQ